MGQSFFDLLAGDIGAHLVGQPLLWGFDAVVVVDAKDKAFQNKLLLDFCCSVCESGPSYPFVLGGLLFKPVNGVVTFVVKDIPTLLVQVMVADINNFIDVHYPRHLLGELYLPVDGNYCISGYVLVYELFHCGLDLSLLMRHSQHNVNLHFLVHGVRLLLTNQFHPVSLHPLKIDFPFLLDPILVNLHSEVAVEALLFRVLNGPVHDVPALGLRVLH